jgi:hypothetical protein
MVVAENDQILDRRRAAVTGSYPVVDLKLLGAATDRAAGARA